MKHVEVKVHTDNYVLSPLELNATRPLELCYAGIFHLLLMLNILSLR